MARLAHGLFGLVFAAAGCGAPRPPAELAGLWSAGPAACAGRVGVRFGPNGINAVYDRQVETLFRDPRYQVEHSGEAFRVRIVYQLPAEAGGARGAGAYGVLVLARQPGGGIAPMAHNIVDGRTGAVRVRVENDPATALLTLSPCGSHAWREELRGRRDPPAS
jgi:hypothetical protein